MGNRSVLPATTSAGRGGQEDHIRTEQAHRGRSVEALAAGGPAALERSAEDFRTG